jgi:hypothetical protein
MASKRIKRPSPRAGHFDLRAQVDQSEGSNGNSRIAFGVSARRALGTTACARRSKRPKQATVCGRAGRGKPLFRGSPRALAFALCGMSHKAKGGRASSVPDRVGTPPGRRPRWYTPVRGIERADGQTSEPAGNRIEGESSQLTPAGRRQPPRGIVRRREQAASPPQPSAWRRPAARGWRGGGARGREGRGEPTSRRTAAAEPPQSSAAATAGGTAKRKSAAED